MSNLRVQIHIQSDLVAAFIPPTANPFDKVYRSRLVVEHYHTSKHSFICSCPVGLVLQMRFSSYEEAAVKSIHSLHGEYSCEPLGMVFLDGSEVIASYNQLQ